MPQTQTFLSWVREAVQSSKDEWAAQLFTGEDIGKCALKNAFALGGVNFANQVINHIEDMTEELEVDMKTGIGKGV